ncbi:hypothetical protein HK102_000575 [Quaeritorhiza haematococci]|nr:hypothetical protein HK102_000575 [Quaeritorhiza haematococci]
MLFTSSLSTAMATASAPTNASLPVLFFIHGGSFEGGSAGLTIGKLGDLAADINAIVVSINYRLSVFGFLDLGGFADVKNETTASASSNFGIMDQRIALEWVFENIAAFGGDPNRVTVCGHSAGALSTLFHMSNPNVRKRIRNYILMSPPASGLRTRRQSQDVASEMARNVGCAPDNNYTQTKSCILGKSSNDILNAYGGRLSTKGGDEQTIFSQLAMVFSPVMDGVEIKGTFLDIMRAEPLLFEGMNIMIGTASNEADIFFEHILRNVSTPTFNVFTDALFRSKSSSVQRFYGSTSMGFLENRKEVLSTVMTDWFFACPLRRAVQNRPTGANIFSYILETGWDGNSNLPIGQFCGGRACHGVELLLLTQNSTDPQHQQIASHFKTYLSRLLWASDVNSNAVDSKSLPLWPKLPSTGSFHPSTTPMPVLRFPNPVPGFPDIVLPVVESEHPRKEACDFWDRTGYFPLPTSVPKVNVGLRISIIVVLWVFWCGVLLLQISLFCAMRRRIQKIFISGTRASSQWTSSNSSKTTTIYEQQTPPAVCSIKIESQFGDAGDMGTIGGMGLECHKLSYCVRDDDEGKELLRDVSFSVAPGSLAAVMGPSGCGKTTLLSLVSGHIQSMEAGKKITLNGNSLTSLGSKGIQSVLAFVPHNEAPFDGLTPREVLIHAALLGTPHSDDSIGQLVSQMMLDFGVLECADVVIAKESSISAGQRRKLSLAVVLLQKPDILVLDEPTSGLDAKSALDVMAMLKFLALKRGKTVLCSIHQPRKEIFDLFSQVLVMNAGRLVFDGDVESSVDHFGGLAMNLDGSSERVSRANVADRILDIVSEMVNPVQTPSNENVTKPISRKPHPPSSPEDKRQHRQQRVTTGNSKRNNLITNIATLNHRWWITRPLRLKLQMFAVVLVIVPLFSLVQKRSSIDLITLGLITKGMMYALLFLHSIKNVPLPFEFYADLDAFVSDYQQGRVSPLAFFLHRSIYDTAVQFVEGLLGCFLMYALIGGELEVYRLMTILTIFILHYSSVLSIFSVIYSTPMNRSEAPSITYVLSILLAFTGGLLIKGEDTAVYWVLSFFQYLNPTYWASAMFARVIMRGAGECLVRNIWGECEAATGDVLLENMRVDRVDLEVGMACLLGIFATAKFVQFWAIFWTLHHQRVSNWMSLKRLRMGQ